MPTFRKWAWLGPLLTCKNVALLAQTLSSLFVTILPRTLRHDDTPLCPYTRCRGPASLHSAVAQHSHHVDSTVVNCSPNSSPIHTSRVVRTITVCSPSSSISVLTYSQCMLYTATVVNDEQACSSLRFPAAVSEHPVD